MADKPEQPTEQGHEERDSAADQPEQEQAPEPESTAQAAEDADQQAPDRDPEAEIARLQDALLRLRAETENQRKRMEREFEKSRRFAMEGVMRDLLQVLDSLDQGLQSGSSSDGDRLREGMELTHRLLVKVLDKHGLEVIEPDGDRFDPQMHEAMAAEPSTEAEPDTVLQVIQKGYRLNDRLLRPARVVVAKPAEGGE